LLKQGAVLIRVPQDLLDAVYGVGVRSVADGEREGLGAEQRAVLDAIAGGANTIGALKRASVGAGDVLSTLVELEVAGLVRRGPGGRYVALA